MKAEERHELKENDLQGWLQYGFPLWIKRNGSYLLLVAALILLGYQVWNYYNGKRLNKLHEGWSELLATEQPGVEDKPTKLQAIIDEYDAKPVRAMALRDLGLAYLDSLATGQIDAANASANSDRQDTMARAQAAFDRVIREFPDQTLAVGGARLGLADLAEDRGDWEAARQQYQILSAPTGPFANSAFAAQATQKIAELDKLKATPRLALLPAPPAATTPAPHLGAAGPNIFPMSPESTVMPPPTTIRPPTEQPGSVPSTVTPPATSPQAAPKPATSPAATAPSK